METLNILNSKGVRVTHQRMAVYRALQKMGHAAAEDIFNEVKSDYPMISFATVYSILQVFKKENLISEMKIDFGKSTFDIRVDNHHHFMCRRCGKIYDIDIAPCDTLKKGKVNGHRIESFQGYFYGICKKCKKG